MTNDRFEQTLAMLRGRFIERSHEHRQKLDELRNAIVKEPSSNEVLLEIERLCHTLHGGAGTFGFPDVGDVAGDAERLTKQFIRGQLPLDRIPELDAALSRVEQALALVGTMEARAQADT